MRWMPVSPPGEVVVVAVVVEVEDNSKEERCMRFYPSI